MTDQTHHYRSHLQIGEVAARAGVNPQTLRYYEREGLLPHPRRLPSGYRVYPPNTVNAVRFIKHSQGLGFRLTEISVLQRWADGEPDHCERVRTLTNARIADIDRKIADLQAKRDSLRQMVAACEDERAGRSCPISKAIDESTRWTTPLNRVTCPHYHPPSRRD